MPKFRKKPVEIEAIQWNGHNLLEVTDFIGKDATIPHSGHTLVLLPLTEDSDPCILEPFDWVIRGVKGEIYRCPQEVFDLTYEPM